jgi:uncharacterized protein YecT (DUF1311 family)
MKNIINSIFVFLLFISAAYGEEASFDCSKAQSKVEHMICSSPDLSNMDDAMAFSYLIASAESKSADMRQLAQQQSAWLKERDSCKNETCVKDQYEKQVQKLDAKVCDFYTGGAMGDSICSGNKLDILNKLLEKLQKRYEIFVMKEYDKPDNFEIQPKEVNSALIKESKAWKNYINAKCWLDGINEGGSFGWKNAFAQDCVVEETYKRIKQRKDEIKENAN